MGILILCALVVLVSGYLAWENYITAKKEDSPVTPSVEDLPTFDSKLDWTVAPATPAEIVTASTDAHSTNSIDSGVSETAEKQEKLKPTVSETKVKRGRKPGTKSPTSIVKDSYKKRGNKGGFKSKKDKGNDLLLS